MPEEENKNTNKHMPNLTGRDQDLEGNGEGTKKEVIFFVNTQKDVIHVAPESFNTSCQWNVQLFLLH